MTHFVSLISYFKLRELYSVVLNVEEHQNLVELH